MASDAAFGVVEQLWRPVATLWIRAPHARQRTTFEKDDGANARAIVERELLDVEDQAFRCAVSSSFAIHDSLGVE